MSNEIDNPRVAELRALINNGNLSALDRVCQRIRDTQHSRPLSEQQAQRIAELIDSPPRATDKFKRGMVVAISEDTVEFRRFGDTHATVVEPRSKNVRVWTHTSKRLRSIRANKLYITDEVDVRNPYDNVDLPDLELQARIDRIMEARRSRTEKELDETGHRTQGQDSYSPGFPGY